MNSVEQAGPVVSSGPKPYGQPILIIGGDRGGEAMLRMFLDLEMVRIVGVFDPNPRSPALVLAREIGVPVFVDLATALQSCRAESNCIVYNMSQDPTVPMVVERSLGPEAISGDLDAKLIWRVVTNLKRVKEDFHASQRQFKSIFENAMDGIIIYDADGTIHSFNPAAERVFGYWQHEILGRSITDLLPSLRLLPGPAAGAATASITDTGVSAASNEFSAIRKGGDSFPCELSASGMFVSGQTLFIGIVRDVTERKRAQESIVALAHHDFLTKLPNRLLFKDRLEHAVAVAQRKGEKLAVLFVDLDGFKGVNDALGHRAGDHVLLEVARRLQATVRSTDTVARIGGDEFTVILTDIQNHSDVDNVSRKILASLSEPVDTEGAQRNIGASIGIAMYPEDAQDFDGLLRLADEAMYSAKAAGKNAFVFHRREISV